MIDPQLTRRKLLKSGLATAASRSLPAVIFLAAEAGAADEKQSGNLQSHMIWSAQSPPVQVKPNGLSAYTRLLADPQRVEQTFDRHTVFLKQIHLDELPSKALILLFAYTRYRLYVNGHYQGRGPSRFQNQRPEYDARDITSAFRIGTNTVMVLVHRDAPTGRIMGHAAGFAARIEHGHGRVRRAIVTDASWLSRPDLSFGVRREAWSSIEESVDGRLGIDYTSPDLNDAAWQASVPIGSAADFTVWPRSTPLQMEKPRPWVNATVLSSTSLHAGDATIFELPEIIQGYHVLRMTAPAGSVVEVANLLPEGQQSGTSLYTTRGGEQEWMGGDTFAMQRLSVRVVKGEIKLLAAAAVEVRYPFERAGSFECSDPSLTRLWNICARSLELLSEDSYVDCADRERVEWTDDTPPAFDCTSVIMRGPPTEDSAFWGDNRLTRSLLQRIALTQQPDGQLKAHSCSERFDIHAIMEDRSCDWVVTLRQYYESSGDKGFVVEMWPVLVRLMQWFLQRRTERGLVLAREWGVWDNPLRYQVCEGATLNGMVYRSLVDAAYLAKQIGRQHESTDYAKNADRLRSDFNIQLWNSEASAYDGALFGPGSKNNPQMGDENRERPIVNGRHPPTAQAALFALYCDIVPQERLTALREWLLAHGSEVKGPMSHYYLFQAMYRMQTPEQDSSALIKMRAGWKAQLDSPWQTTWEDLTDRGGSKVHIYGMAPGYFLTAYVLGVRRIGPVADRAILLEPRCGDLTSATGTAITEFGPVKIQWTNTPQAFSMDCDLLAHTKSTLRLYRRGMGHILTINGKQTQVSSSENFVEIYLQPGRQQIRYDSLQAIEK
jgi:alpha-L-rhamnosidase